MNIQSKFAKLEWLNLLSPEVQQLSSGAFRVYMYLILHANKEYKTSVDIKNTLTTQCNMCKQSVLNAIEELESKGIISVERRNRRLKQSNIYTLEYRHKMEFYKSLPLEKQYEYTYVKED